MVGEHALAWKLSKSDSVISFVGVTPGQIESCVENINMLSDDYEKLINFAGKID